jgi:hypothetical protein
VIAAEENTDQPIELTMKMPQTPMIAKVGNRRVTRWLATVALTLAVAPSGVGCRKETPRKADPPAQEAAPPARHDLLVFPDELLVEDTAINNFVTQAMEVCAAGDYEAFRLLWSVRDDPLPRAEFEQGWKAVETIRIRALEKVMLAPDPDSGRAEAQAVYTVYAQVELDPSLQSHGVEARREVILMMVRERDEWRLARAPNAMRTWIRERHAGKGGESAEENEGDSAPVESPD